MAPGVHTGPPGRRWVPYPSATLGQRQAEALAGAPPPACTRSNLHTCLSVCPPEPLQGAFYRWSAVTVPLGPATRLGAGAGCQGPGRGPSLGDGRVRPRICVRGGSRSGRWRPCPHNSGCGPVAAVLLHSLGCRGLAAPSAPQGLQAAGSPGVSGPPTVGFRLQSCRSHCLPARRYMGQGAGSQGARGPGLGSACSAMPGCVQKGDRAGGPARAWS